MSTPNEHGTSEADDDRTVRLFLESAAELDVETEYVTAEEVTDAIGDAVDGATVGASIPFEEVELPDDVVVDPTDKQLRAARTGVTAATFAIASYGTVAVGMTANKDGPVSLFPPRHVAVVMARDVVPDMSAAFERLESTFDRGTNDVIFETGPSSTGDMGSLVRGVHGPAEVTVIVVDATNDSRDTS